ncbi:hypothetical protein QP359_09265 [Lactobacillus paragasseri]|jgi:hypothetical protein|uniref:WapI family immunity protein n=1 Tax=Lactobacillus paragasseri TaxID=2107999 RepID=UPI00057E5FA6|nr:hypothetical protein [Lactobacillus paragasseri]MDK7068639.1 hypothetical protein [Lactobacillus paragasseri]
MKFGVKLSSSSLIIYLKIENYSLVLNKYDDNWVTVNLRIQVSGLDVNYRLNSLLSEEIDELLDEIHKLFSNADYENELVSLEEDFEFIFSSSEKQKTMQVRYYLDDNRNFIAFNIVDNELEHFYIYLQLITGEKSLNDVIVQNCIEKGNFQEWT